MNAPFTAPDGTVYTFDHLKPFDAVVSLTVNKVKYAIPVSVIFSNHCFTDGKDYSVQQSDPLYILTDSTGHRAFCVERWNTSLSLPGLLHDVIAENQKCYRLEKDSNYIHIHDADQRNRFSGWYIFFHLNRSKDGEALAVRLSVTSHHRRMQQPQSLKWRDPSPFRITLASWLGNRPDFLAKFEPLPEEPAQE